MNILFFNHQVSDFDSIHLSDGSQTPVTRDFIALCIGILTIVIVILLIALCKWSRCLCLKENLDEDLESGSFSTMNTSVNGRSSSRSSSNHQRHHHRHHHHHHSSGCQTCSNDQNRYQTTTRSGLLSPPSPFNYGHNNSHDFKLPRVTITVAPTLNSQQLVPRLSISPQSSTSSINQNTGSSK